MQKSLQVYLPAPKSLITQRFGDNANISYKRDGLRGHTSYDFGMAYGAPIYNCTPDAYCYSRMHEGDTYLNNYRALFFLVETEIGIYEVSYGHVSGFVADVGETYQVGDIIGYVGNTGTVFAGNHEVTEKEKEAGSHAGAHLHGPQIRVLRKDKKRLPSTQYITTIDGYLKKDGFYYAIPNYNNGYNGCVSLAPFSTETLASDFKTIPVLSSPVSSPNPQEVIQPVQALFDTVAKLPTDQQQKYFPNMQELINWLQKLFTPGG